MSNAHKQQIDAIARQNAEFDALRFLRDQFHRLCQTPVVDDNYPFVRHDYEYALRQFLDALKANGRELWR